MERETIKLDSMTEREILELMLKEHLKPLVPIGIAMHLAIIQPTIGHMPIRLKK